VRIRYRYRDGEKLFDHPCQSVVLGRPRHGVHIDIDLTPDLRVSRPHARISIAEGHYWIEDLNSANGTELAGEQIKGKGKLRVDPGQTIRVSDTTVEVEIPVTRTSLDDRLCFDDRTIVTAPDTRLDIGAIIDAGAPVLELGQAVDPARAEALALLYELPLRFGEATGLDALFQTIIERLVAIIPAASRGALLLQDAESRALLLRHMCR